MANPIKGKGIGARIATGMRFTGEGHRDQSEPLRPVKENKVRYLDPKAGGFVEMGRGFVDQSAPVRNYPPKKLDFSGGPKAELMLRGTFENERTGSTALRKHLGRGGQVVFPKGSSMDKTLGTIAALAKHKDEELVDDSVYLHDHVIHQAHDLSWVRKMTRAGVKLDNVTFVKYWRRFALRVSQAERFVVDNEALRAVMEASMVGNCAKIEGMLGLARLPYKSIWVEFDARVRVKSQREAGALADPDKDYPYGRGGFLIERIKEDDPTTWTATYCGITNEKHAVAEIGGCGYLMSTEGEALPMAPDEELPSPLVYNDMGLAPQGTNYGMHAKPWGLVDPADRKTTTASQQLHEHCRVLLPGVWLALQQPETAGKLLLKAIDEGRGDARFLVALLSMINTIPMSTVVRAGSSHRGPNYKKMEYFGHTVIKLNIKKSTAVRRMLTDAARWHQRAHMVRGHYRTYQRGAGPLCRRDLHEWKPADANGRRDCCKCSAWQKWIAEHPAGDASLGWVRHDYKVVAKQ